MNNFNQMALLLDQDQALVNQNLLVLVSDLAHQQD